MGGSVSTLSTGFGQNPYQDGFDPTGGILVYGERNTILLKHLAELSAANGVQYLALSSAPIRKGLIPVEPQDAPVRAKRSGKNVYVLRLASPEKPIGFNYLGDRGVLHLSIYTDVSLSSCVGHYGTCLPPVFVNETVTSDDVKQVRNIVRFGILEKREIEATSPLTPVPTDRRTFHPAPVDEVRVAYAHDSKDSGEVQIYEQHAFSIIRSAPMTEGIDAGEPMSEYSKIRFTTNKEDNVRNSVIPSAYPLRLHRFSGFFEEDTRVAVPVTNIKRIPVTGQWTTVADINLVDPDPSESFTLIGTATFQNKGMFRQSFYAPLELRPKSVDAERERQPDFTPSSPGFMWGK